MHKVKRFFYWIFAWPALLTLLLLRGERKKKFLEDLNRFCLRYRGRKVKNIYSDFYSLLITQIWIRNVFYMRIGHFDKLIKWFLPGVPNMELNTKSERIGGGLHVEHGWAMVLDAESVGKNLWINQGVTIGWGRGGHPIIGDNVRIGAGAVVIGGIRIGNNVNIGANAIVVEDVPDNCTVCSPKATIVKYHKEPTINAKMTAELY